MLCGHLLALLPHNFDALYARNWCIELFGGILTQLFELFLDFSGVDRILVGAVILLNQV